MFSNTLKFNNLLSCYKYIFLYSKHVRLKQDYVINEPTSLSSASLKRKLRSWIINVDDGHTCFTINCSFCNVQSKKLNPSKLYINKISGFYLCGCGKYSGNWETLEKFMDTRKTLTSPKQVSVLKQSLVDDVTLSEWDVIEKRTRKVDELSEEEFSEMSQSITIENLQKNIFQQLQARFDLPKKKIYFPLFNINFSKIIGYKTLKVKTLEESTFPVTESYGVSFLKSMVSSKSSSVVLVTKLLDIINLAQHKINMDTICLPYSISSLPQQVLPILEKYDRVIIWFNNDLQSFDAAKHFAKKLNEQRCFIVRPNVDYTLPSSIQSNAELKKILNGVTPVWHKSITTFASLREDVLFDLKNIEKIEGIKWTRYPTLNKILKGHRRGELTVLTGPTGSGKTTFISEYSLDLAMQGVNTLWGSFEIRNSRLARTMLQQMSGIPLDEHLDQFDFWADQFEQLPIYFMTFHGQQSIKIVMEAVEHATYVHDIAHVIIDNVQFMMGIAEDTKHMDRFWKQDIIVSAFRSFATKKNCHVTLIIHPRKERETEDLTTSSIFGGAKASQEADNVLLIQDKRLTSIRGKKYLQVAKNRYSGDLGIIPLDFDKAGLSYRQKKKRVDEKKSTTIVNESEEVVL